MTEMKEFEVIRVARSDGADSGPGYWPVTAPPVAPAKKTTKDAATEKTPRTKPQMIRLAEDDPRFVEWRVKLGILLKQELCPTPDEGNPWYVKFPQGYWLYEKSKHLWVSGYPIKAKLFKSPQEFAVHLIWLLSASMDYKDCCCAHCNASNPAKLSAAMEDTLVITSEPLKVDKAPLKVTPVPLPPIPGQPMSKPAAPVSRSSSTQPASVKQTPTPVPPPAQKLATPVTATPPTQHVPLQTQAQTQAQAQAQQPQATPPQQPQQQAPRHPQPQPISQPQLQQAPIQPQQIQPRQQPQPVQHQQQQMMHQTQVAQLVPQGPLLFRAGELVWYQNGNTWRLGVVAACSNGNNELMPIGHGSMPQPNVTKPDASLRPFHAFTVPPVAIQDLANKMFDEIPWDAIVRARGADGKRREVLALDASKMAAVKIDYSHSLWSPLSDDPNAMTTYYHGCFFGAERVELNDALRIRVDSAGAADSPVLAVRYIYTTTNMPNEIFFRGPVYVPVKGDVPDASSLVPDEHLPLALREEMQWRNSVDPHHLYRYALLKPDDILEQSSVRGRFYPTHRLMPILNPEGFKHAMAQGQVDELHAHLNNRMDGGREFVGRKKNRMETIGAAVSPTARIALEPYVREEGLQDLGAATQTE